ncbi:MAG: Eco57I restriction-modification methylase domain-containing protein [Paludibacteraceae bacterium]|nr:Eco57I restriction-modification methylase domain-containing protein [Paludibacteraceae bacterium]
MDNGLYGSVYNPDVLSCIANLSNDEVFTSPDIANKMLDLLPQELFENPDTTFLDPACKSGVFLREIAKRLIVGLEKQIPDLDKRVKHIFTKQLFGIAITELTSLLSRRSVYCSKYPNSEFSLVKFNNPEGNIRFKKLRHTWQGNKCKYCGATKSEYDRPATLESHAYQFIHLFKIEDILGNTVSDNMKFDVIISNPPYQLSDGGNSKSAKPIYQLFVEQAKKLQPRYITMIIPSRWFVGGKGLDKFREDMLNDHRISKLVDYENFKDVFPGVDLAGGACYFLWDRDRSSEEKECEVTNFGIAGSMSRPLNEFSTFIRQNMAIDIVKRVRKNCGTTTFLNERVSARKPFGLDTTYQPKDTGIPCYFIQRIGKKFADPTDVIDKGYNNKWKFLAPMAPIAGQTDFSSAVGFYSDRNTIIAEPGEVSTESFIVLGAFDSEEETRNFKSYIFTKTVRFLLLQAVISQHVSKENFCFIPDLGTYDREYTDEYLRDLWNITDPKECEYIDSRIRDIE